MNRPALIAETVLCLLLATCGPFEDPRGLLDIDLSPPVILSARSVDPTTVEMVFDEVTRLQTDTLAISPALAIGGIQQDSTRVRLTVAVQTAGRPYSLEGVAEDRRGNCTNFLLRFYGHNPMLPVIRINEFTCRGSATHPDRVELKLFSAGNLGGVTLYQGTPGSYRDRLVFPPFTVEPEEFVVVHFKPAGTPEEIDETGEKTESGGLDASNSAYDFWVFEGSGINGNNGVLSLYDSPGGKPIDAVLYSNRTSDSDERYMGFGTKDTMERALELAEDGGWVAETGSIRPEDGVSPEGSTATRSLCRWKGEDTDTRRDWHIVPTRQASFGEENSEELYTP